MFRKDWFPPTAALGTFAEELDGSSGNADLDKLGGGGALADREAGPGTDIGPRIIGAAGEDVAGEAEDDTHGVFRCGCLKPLAAGAATAADCRGGKGPADGGGAAPGTILDEEGTDLRLGEEAAALATRSSTWPEDCPDERVAVDCFAFSKRPPVIPDH